MYSIDALMAAGIIVLCIGVILNNYEIITINTKEARFSNENATIAANAAEMLLASQKCELDYSFKEQGYGITNCSKISELSLQKKPSLLIPEQFKCYFEIDGSTLSIEGCEETKPNEKIKDITVIERKFLKYTNQLTKTTYEKCIKEGCQGNFEEKTMVVYIWR